MVVTVPRNLEKTCQWVRSGPFCGVRDWIKKARGIERVRLTVIYEKGPASWGAYGPDLPGVITVGDSREQVERLIQEAIEFYLEGLREEALPIPRSIPFRPSGRGTPGGLSPKRL